MYYLKMRPEQIKDAVSRNVPVIMAAGSVEYHGPHLPVGTDCLIAETIVRKVEERCECIVMPSLPFSPTMFWAAGPEEGEFDFDPSALGIYVKEMLMGLVRIGFRRIYILQHHQGAEGLPALILRRAAREVIQETAKDWGEGWGRLPFKEYPNPKIFKLIQVAYIDSFSACTSGNSEKCPIGHGGKGETQLILSEYPESVKMDLLDDYKKEKAELPDWLLDANQATFEEGKKWIEFCVQGWVRELSTAIKTSRGR